VSLSVSPGSATFVLYLDRRIKGLARKSQIGKWLPGIWLNLKYILYVFCQFPISKFFLHH
ncbi:hypothetical protein, partial [Baaleninema sp.]|uniref:hypothetical protein n=1 Tax=Baaleninema sp. TaxID=3101197 RepID=UPI003D06172D